MKKIIVVLLVAVAFIGCENVVTETVTETKIQYVEYNEPEPTLELWMDVDYTSHNCDLVLR